MLGRPYYAELCFCNQYYIADIDVLNDNGCRQLVKIKNITLSFLDKSIPYRKVDNAQIFRIYVGAKNFCIALKQLAPSVYLIAYLTRRDFVVKTQVQNKSSRQRNADNLRKVVLHNIVSSDERANCSYVYSEDRLQRFEIRQCDNSVKVVHQRFELDADADIYFPQSLDTNFYTHLGAYENYSGVSVYNSMQQAYDNINKVIEQHKV